MFFDMQLMKSSLQLFLFVWVLSSYSEVTLGSPLKLSSSGHYFVYKGKTISLIGDSGTQVVMQNANIDYRQWIDDNAAAGVNALHLWSFMVPRQKQDGSRVERRYGYVYPGLTPWARRTSGAKATDQLYRWDLLQFDEMGYWRRLKDLVSYAVQNDMLVGVTVFFGWPKHDSDWNYHPFNIINGGHLTDNNQVQIIYTPGKEVLEEAWSDNWLSAKKTQWIWEKFSEKLINETKVFGNVFFIFMDEHSYSEGNAGDHFAQFFRKREALWGDHDARRNLVDIVTEQRSNPKSQFFRRPFRPHLELEKRPYKGKGVRDNIWEAVISGGHYFHHNDERQETVQTGVMVYDPNVKEGRKDKVLERAGWLGNASRFINHRVKLLDELVPHDELATGARCLANPGFEYVLYAKIGGEISINLTEASGNFKAEWFDPRNGGVIALSDVVGETVFTIRTPDANDWVLHLYKALK